MSFQNLTDQLRPVNYFANFSAIMPSGEKAVHVQFITTTMNPFVVGPSTAADSVTHAIISYNKRDVGEHVMRLAEGTVYGSVEDDFSIYQGRKKAFERALNALREEGQEAALKGFFSHYPPGSVTHETRIELLTRLNTEFRNADKRMRAFMWDKFLKFFPTEESV